MPTAHSREGDRERAREIAERGLILRTTVGSSYTGCRTRGPTTATRWASASSRPTTCSASAASSTSSTAHSPRGAERTGDLDLTVYGLRKWCGLALKGSPTVLLPLFVPKDHVVARTGLGRELQALAPAFVSRAAGRAFPGYLDAQRLGLTGERHATRTRELSAVHGYDTKYAMHPLRIAHQGIELLGTGRITLPVAEPARSALREVRAGEVPLDEVLRRLEQATAELELASRDPGLPARSDTATVDAFLVSAYRRAWDEGLTA